MINKRDNFRKNLLFLYSEICVLYFLILHFFISSWKTCQLMFENFFFLVIFDTCDVAYNWFISLLPPILLDNLFGKSYVNIDKKATFKKCVYLADFTFSISFFFSSLSFSPASSSLIISLENRLWKNRLLKHQVIPKSGYFKKQTLSKNPTIVKSNYSESGLSKNRAFKILKFK